MEDLESDFDIEPTGDLESPAVSDSQTKMRLDKFLSDTLKDLSRNQYIRLIESGEVLEKKTQVVINKPDYKVQEGQVFIVHQQMQNLRFQNQKTSLWILFMKMMICWS